MTETSHASNSTDDNAAAHILVLRWGRLVSFRALHDEQRSAQAMLRLGAGLTEAIASPRQLSVAQRSGQSSSSPASDQQLGQEPSVIMNHCAPGAPIRVQVAPPVVWQV